MIKRLLYIVIVVFGTSVYGQSEILSPPPPCGLFDHIVCDLDEDGYAIANLVEIFPFDLVFCPRNSEDFHPIKFYESREDAENDINPIVNPSTYINTTPFEQTIYYRSDIIEPVNNSVGELFGEGVLFVIPPPTITKPSALIACDINDNGFGNFKLDSVEDEILSGQQFYNVRFYESLIDAQNFVNHIPNEYINVIAYMQTIYARVFIYEDQACFDIVEVDLVVQDTCGDLDVTLQSSASPRPGFNYVNKLIIKNNGSGILSGSDVSFVHDPKVVLQHLNDFGNGYSITTTSNGFVWHFSDLNPGETQVITITTEVLVSTPLGELITNVAEYSGNDSNANNNRFELSETVIGSYDPNDIMESHGPKIKFDEFSSHDYLYYTIRFQNVGTADAINVRIENTLDDKLDESTFQLLHTSHTTYGSGRVGKKLTWTFSNIHLPSESMDEPNSHGYVVYKIKPKSGYAIGDIIPNRAEIYFDFNPAVVTNTFETEFVRLLSANNKNIEVFNIHPNPANSIVNLNFNYIGKKRTINVYSIQGKLVLSKPSNLKTEQLEIAQLSKGMYFVEISTSTGKSVKKLVVK